MCIRDSEKPVVELKNPPAVYTVVNGCACAFKAPKSLLGKVDWNSVKLPALTVPWLPVSESWVP